MSNAAKSSVAGDDIEKVVGFNLNAVCFHKFGQHLRLTSNVRL